MGFVFYNESQFRDFNPSNKGFSIIDNHCFEKPMLDAYREYIKDDKRRQELHDILKTIKAKGKGYTHLEKGYKRYPRGFGAEMTNADLSLYKGMATFKTFDPKLIEDGEKLIEKLYEVYEDMLPLQEFMYEVSLRVADE